MFYSIAKAVVHFFVRIYFNVQMTGREKLPQGNYVLVSNHTSNWDPPMIGAMFPTRFCFFAKEELFENKFCAFFLKRLHAMPVNRKNADIGAVKASLEGLKKGLSLIIFPEGTRHGFSKGVEIKSGFINLAHKAGVPVVPVRIEGEYKFRSKIRIIVSDPIDLSIYKARKLTDEQAEQVKDTVVSLIRAEESVCRLS